MKEDNPKITILLATYNRAHFIRDTLDSILAQTYKNWECIIVDDNSQDNTRQVIQKYCNIDSRFSYFLKTDDYQKGLSGTRNYGLDLAEKRNADFIQFFDDDDIMHPKKLELQILPLINDETLDFTVCKYLGFRSLRKIDFSNTSSDIPIQSINLAIDFLFSRIRINSAGPLFRSYLLKNEKFEENLPYGEEWELFNRIFFKYSPKYIPINKSLFYYRQHRNSITSKQGTNCEKLGAQLIILETLWDFLSFNNLLSKENISFFLRQFLLQYHNKKYLSKIKKEISESHELSIFQKNKFLLIMIFHKVYMKIMRIIIFKF